MGLEAFDVTFWLWAVREDTVIVIGEDEDVVVVFSYAYDAVLWCCGDDSDSSLSSIMVA